MKNFFTILRFELKNLLANKVYIGVTVLLVIILAGIMFWPRIDELISPDDGVVDPGDAKVILIGSDNSELEMTSIHEAFSAAFASYEVRLIDSDLDSFKKQIVEGDAEAAFIFNDTISYKYYVNNLSMYDQNTVVADEILRDIYRTQAMIDGGISETNAMKILTQQIEHETENLGKDQGQNFFYTYFMVMALYMIIMLYGQIVATNVASEKSSRAMEVLITSANPTAMMFGKILAACLAGMLQLVCIFGSAYVFFNLNKSYWEGNAVINSMFNMPLDVLLYMLVFFILGFFLYACMFGAVGSTASKVEDINTSTMPIMLLFMVSFFIAMSGMASAKLDTPLMKAASYIPFTSPVAMFSRIAMSTVAPWEIILSIGLLVIFVVAIGVLAAKIYRVGVLLYGTQPKPSEIIKAIRKA